MSRQQWSPQRRQQSCALRSPRCPVADHADCTAVRVPHLPPDGVVRSPIPPNVRESREGSPSVYHAQPKEPMTEETLGEKKSATPRKPHHHDRLQHAATYVPLRGDGKAFRAWVMACILSMGVQRKHQAPRARLCACFPSCLTGEERAWDAPPVAGPVSRITRPASHQCRQWPPAAAGRAIIERNGPYDGER